MRETCTPGRWNRAGAEKGAGTQLNVRANFQLLIRRSPVSRWAWDS